MPTDQPIESAGTTWLRVNDVARLMGVSANTVRRWTDAGRIPARRSPGGHRRYRLDDVRALGPETGDDAGRGLAGPPHGAGDLREVYVELTDLLVSDPRRVPELAARRICELTGAGRCDVFRREDGRLSLTVSVDDGRLDQSRIGGSWDIADWVPAEGPPEDLPVVAVRTGDGLLDERSRNALLRRGCRALAWAPIVRGGRLAGAVEVSDVRPRDFGSQAELIADLARLCGQAMGLAEAYAAMLTRERALRELLDIAEEVAESHDLSHFVERFSLRLMSALNADGVTVYRVDGGVIRLLHELRRDGASVAGAVGNVLDTATYPSLERTLLDFSPLAVHDLGDSRLSAAEVDLYRQWGFASSLTMPLVAGAGIVGLVDFFDDAERDWNQEVEFLTGVLQLVAGVFDSSTLLEEVETRSRLQHQLGELAARVAEAGSQEEIALEAARRLRAIAACDDCDVWWLEEGYLRCLASVDSRGVDDSVCGKTLQLEHLPSSRQLLEDRSVLVLASLDDPRVTDYERRDWAKHGYRSTISLPLVAGDELVGMIDLFDTRERDYGEVRDVVLSAAGITANALRSADLMSSLRRGNSALRGLVELGDKLNEAEGVHELAIIVAADLRAMLTAEDCDVWALEDGRMRCLASVDSRGVDEQELGSELDLATYQASAVALKANEPMVIGDLDSAGLQGDELAAYRRWGYRSMVSLPLVVEGRALGLIDVFDTKVRDYTDMLDLIRNVARLLAGAFEKALLLERLESGNRDLRMLVDSGIEFGATLDVGAVLRLVAARVLAVSEADACNIFRIDGDEVEALVCLGGRSEEDRAGRRYPMSAHAAYGRVRSERAPETCLDVLTDPQASGSERAEALACGYRAVMDVPLVSHGEVIGFLSAHNREPRAFAREEVIVGLAQIAGQAVATAALFEREQAANRETQLLNEIATRTAASLNLEEIVKAAVDELGQLLPFESYSLLLGSGGCVDRVFSSDPTVALFVGLAEERLGTGLLQALRERRVIKLDFPEDHGVPPGAHLPAGLRSAVAIALPSDGGILGALNLVSDREHALAGADERLLERVATHLSLAIRNAQLYDEIKGMHLGNLKALSSALNVKDYYTQGHAARVAAYSVMLGVELGWPEELVGPLEEVAYLHDVGKISISDRVLLKPGRLNQQEWQQMRHHPVFSADIVRPLFPEELVLGVRHHHERYDGKGYPDGLQGEKIPLLARAMAVVDAYDAMSCRRPYKAALSYPQCVEELRRCEGAQFDPQMVEAFLRVLGDLAVRRVEAECIATEAASRISGEKHAALCAADDESSPEYLEISRILREVRDAHPTTRFLTTHARRGKDFIIGVDPEEDERQRSHLGDEIFPDEELPQVLAGERPDVITLFADEFGVWVTGRAPVRDASGTIVAAVAADLPALSSVEGALLPVDDRQTFAAMLQSAAVRLSRAEIDSITDALTGLYNHRYLQERLGEELHQAREAGRSLSVLFCDLDHFKEYNDAHGHSQGDAALREVAHVLEQAVRTLDVAGRYGGEEFVVVLVETGLEDALAIAERIRERVRAAGHDAHGAALTASIGVASYPEDGVRREELLDKADRAMYVAKACGRDQVVAFRDC